MEKPHKGMFFQFFEAPGRTALLVDNDVFNCRGNLSTYKELCSLASDLNQPDLIYKFMHLANHHSLWNSKKVGVATCHVT